MTQKKFGINWSCEKREIQIKAKISILAFDFLEQ